jgi:hypothetical protein
MARSTAYSWAWASSSIDIENNLFPYTMLLTINQWLSVTLLAFHRATGRA